MRVNESKARREQGLFFNQHARLLVAAFHGGGQAVQQAQQLVSIFQAAAGQLADNQWMAKHLPAPELFRQRAMAVPQMLNPERGVGENQACANFARRRGIAFKRGSLPANAASRRLL